MHHSQTCFPYWTAFAQLNGLGKGAMWHFLYLLHIPFYIALCMVIVAKSYVVQTWRLETWKVLSRFAPSFDVRRWHIARLLQDLKSDSANETVHVVDVSAACVKASLIYPEIHCTAGFSRNIFEGIVTSKNVFWKTFGQALKFLLKKEPSKLASISRGGQYKTRFEKSTWFHNSFPVAFAHSARTVAYSGYTDLIHSRVHANKWCTRHFHTNVWLGRTQASQWKHTYTKDW